MRAIPNDFWFNYVVGPMETHSAMTLDYEFTGGVNLRRIMRKSHIIPDPCMWMDSVNTGHFATMVYLHNTRIACNDYKRVIQTAVDKGLVQFVHFMTDPSNSFYSVIDYNGGLQKIRRIPVPILDNTRSAETVEYCISRFSGVERNELLDNPRKVVSDLIGENRLDILKMIVPSIVRAIKSFRNLDLVARRGWVDMLDFCLNHSAFQGTVPDKIAVSAAKGGHLNCYKLIHQVLKIHPVEAKEYAFSYGHISILLYMCGDSVYTPTRKAIEWAFQYGHLESIKYLDSVRIRFDPQFTMSACKSGNPELIEYIKTRYKAEFNDSHIMPAIMSGSERSVLLVMHYSGCISLTVDHKVAMVEAGMNEIIIGLQAQGFDMYIDETFKSACSSNHPLASTMIAAKSEFANYPTNITYMLKGASQQGSTHTSKRRRLDSKEGFVHVTTLLFGNK